MKMTHLFQVLLVTSLSFRLTNADNILFMSFPYYGHINPMVKVAAELTKYGHNSYITSPEKFTGKFSPVQKEINYVIIEENQEFTIFSDITLEVLRFRSNRSISDIFAAYRTVCDSYLLNQELFSKLKSFNASLAVIDANFMSNCLAVFAYRLDIPFILQGFQNQVDIHRTPWQISMFPFLGYGYFDEPTILQRLGNFGMNVFDYITPAAGTPGRNIKEYAPERPDITFGELIRQAELYIVDSDSFLNEAFPALPNVKYIGGISSGPAKPLKGKLLEFVNASKNGVIVVSPGTVVSWDNNVKKMEEAFSKIKYDVVWKHSNSSYSRPNVLLTKWLPQNDLLGHPNTKLFITHCGNSGRYESLYNGVPMIAFPVLADQPLNSQLVQRKGFGLWMDHVSFTADELVRNIEEVIENPKYKKNIAKASELYRSQKEVPSEKVARLVNEVLKYGSDHLKSDLQNVPLYQLLMFDIWAVLFVAGSLILYLTAFILRKCFSLACRRKKTKTE